MGTYSDMSYPVSVSLNGLVQAGYLNEVPKLPEGYQFDTGNPIYALSWARKTATGHDHLGTEKREYYLQLNLGNRTDPTALAQCIAYNKAVLGSSDPEAQAPFNHAVSVFFHTKL